MPDIPFPAALVAISAATGRRLQSSDVDDAGQKRATSSLPKPYVADGVAAFRFPDGRMHPAYDMYNPTYPEGTEPGIAKLHYKVEHHPNDTSSYRPEILNFRSIPDLESEGLHVDRSAAGLVIRKGIAASAMTANEEEMQAIAADLPPDATLHRAPIRHVDIEYGGPIQHVAMTWARFSGLEVHAATDPDQLFRALQDRYSFLPEVETLEDMAGNLLKHGTKNGWIVVCREVQDMSFDPAIIQTPAESLLEKLKDDVGGDMDALREVLDEMVHDAQDRFSVDAVNTMEDGEDHDAVIASYSSRASEMNNQGMEAQLEYLLTVHAGAEDIRAEIKTSLRPSNPGMEA